MVLGWRRPGRVERRRIPNNNPALYEAGFVVRSFFIRKEKTCGGQNINELTYGNTAQIVRTALADISALLCVALSVAVALLRLPTGFWSSTKISRDVSGTPLCGIALLGIERVRALTVEMQQLKRLAMPEEFTAGQALYHEGAAHEAESADDARCFVVDAQPKRTVVLGGGDRWSGRCNCSAFVETQRPCRHVVAALLEAHRENVEVQEQRHEAMDAGEALLDALEPKMPLESALRLDVHILCAPDSEEQRLRIALRVGEDRLYVVRDIRQFVRDVTQRRPVTFGKGFTLEPEWMMFSRMDRMLLGTLMALDEAQLSAGKTLEHGKTMELPPLTAARVLRLLMARPFRLQIGRRDLSIRQAWYAPLPVRTVVRASGQGAHVLMECPPESCALTDDCEFVVCGGELLRLPKRQRKIARMLLAHARMGRADFRFDAPRTERLLSDVLPRLELIGEVEIDGVLAQRIVRQPLTAQVYLDQEGRGIAARVVFAYGQQHIDPFAPQSELAPQQNGLWMMRDAAGEQAVLNILAAEGFRVRKARAYLTESDALYAFFSQGIARLMSAAEVHCSEAFRRMTPHRPSLHGTLRMSDGRLLLDMMDGDAQVDELMPILQALRANKRYFQLRDGRMLDLSAMAPWEALADAVSDEEAASAVGASVAMETYRAGYLATLLAQAELPVTVDAEVRQVVDALSGQEDTCPAPLDAVLRPYQVRGFAWMASLTKLRMGGILADDMGLGKTLQTIALLLWRKRGGQTAPALIVAPSSLLYNWQAELAQYAPELTVAVLEGAQAVRETHIDAIRRAGDVDVLITSYPLLRRDIGQIERIAFGVAILDEAQYIKNAVSVSAQAARRIRADARFALTGTPMENHPGELWSIVDFVLPGYLGSLAGFMHRYGEGRSVEGLRARLRPFLMRRLKKDVLADLPEKLEMRLFADMTPEQQRVYQAALLRIKRHVDDVLGQKGFQRGQMEVLAAITQMRLICCHPSLCIPDYSGSSGKLDLLMDILPSALEAGHRALVFSQFTGMLAILQRRMEAQGIRCLYLDGDTPNKQRMQLVRRFNAGEGDVFLISLRAGGAGLNLTGADTVIHYDPWWNPAAEDQATDRAHRIGQTREVQVVRLITHASMEEQVVRLGERKRALFDAMITAGEKLPGSYTQEEIRALFDTFVS